jgi:hypothetical protein
VVIGAFTVYLATSLILRLMEKRRA